MLKLRKKKAWRLLSFLVTLLLIFGLSVTAFAAKKKTQPVTTEAETIAAVLEEDGWYYTTEDVALYLHEYGHLPDNYITKKKAEKLGWSAKSGNLWDVADGYCIGGNKFGNYEGRLPEEEDRQYYEADVNYEGGYRGSDRLIYSNDGFIYFTGDHYNSFELLYTAEGEDGEEKPDEDGWYYSTEDVAKYLHVYGHLPDNYITKKKAEKLGWSAKSGNLWDVADGFCIGGNKFGNYEGQLPEEEDRQYYEADVNYDGGYRGSDRLIYSNDGLIYFTEDHYQTFKLLYGEE